MSTRCGPLSTKAATTALGLGDASALGCTSLSILHVLVQFTKGRLSAGPVIATRRTLGIAAARPVRSRWRRARLLSALCFRLRALWRRLVYRRPGAIIVFLPATIGVLVDIPVTPSVHVAARGFARCRTAVGARAGNCLATCGILIRTNRAPGRRRVLRRRPLVALRDDRTSPLAVGVRALARSSISASVRGRYQI